jgi:hypothetical protein
MCITSARVRHVGLIVLVVLLVSALLGVGVWYLVTSQENETMSDLTPQSVVRAFREAGYEISEVRETDEYIGPLGHVEGGIRFTLHMEDKAFSVLVAPFAESRIARRGAIECNQLDDRMNGGYAYAFARGPVVVQIYPSDKAVGDELAEVLK